MKSTSLDLTTWTSYFLFFNPFGNDYLRDKCWHSFQPPTDPTVHDMSIFPSSQDEPKVCTLGVSYTLKEQSKKVVYWGPMLFPLLFGVQKTCFGLKKKSICQNRPQNEIWRNMVFLGLGCDFDIFGPIAMEELIRRSTSRRIVEASDDCPRLKTTGFGILAGWQCSNM